MAYTPQEWKDNSTQHPASAARFTHMEQGISGAHTLAQAAAESVTGVQAKQAELDKKIEGIAAPAKPTAEDIAPAVRSYLEANPVAVQEDSLSAAVTKAVQERISHLPPAELPADFNTTVENLVPQRPLSTRRRFVKSSTPPSNRNWPKATVPHRPVTLRRKTHSAGLMLVSAIGVLSPTGGPTNASPVLSGTISSATSILLASSSSTLEADSEIRSNQTSPT